jgi:Tol biopolymer transport system component
MKGALAAAVALLAIAAAAGPPAGAQALPAAPASDGTAQDNAVPAPDNVAVAPEPIVPRFVRALAGTAPGSSDANPVWSPDGALVAFERSRGEGKEIVIARRDGTIVKTVSRRPPDEGGGLAGLLPGDSPEASFNAGISWSPSGRRFVFMSNGGEGNYDLYVDGFGAAPAIRLTEHREKDGHAHWSPVADNLVVFVSGRTGKGDLYLMDLMTRTWGRLASGDKGYLYPRWSPDGRRVAVTAGENENHDVYVIDNMAGTRRTIRALTSWPFDDIRPVFAPDGRKVAFYSNYNPEGNPRIWSIVVVAADGTDPRDGAGLAGRVAAKDVIPDVETGPAWMPDGAGIVFVKNDRQEYNPIHVVELASGVERPLKTETKMNHDVACAPDGTIAFRAQVDQWDHLFVAGVEKRAPYR